VIFSVAERLQHVSVLDIVGDHDQVLGRKSCSRSHTPGEARPVGSLSPLREELAGGVVRLRPNSTSLERDLPQLPRVGRRSNWAHPHPTLPICGC
jgi:hypothetical protein